MSGMTDSRALADRVEELAGQTLAATDGDTLSRMSNGQRIAVECAEFIRDHGATIAARLRGEAAQGDFVKIESHWLKNILSAAALLEGTGSILDKREADALRKLVKSAAPAAPAPVAGDDARDLIESFVQHASANPNDHYPRKLVEAAKSWIAGFRAPVAGWLQAVDTELVNVHLGVANADDDFETARRKLSELIQWHIDVSHDPRVNGAPVAGDAVSKLPEKWRAEAYPVTGTKAARLAECAEELTAALAQDRASQAGAAGGMAEWPERFGCNGPEGSFWTGDAELANKLIRATFDRDEWTVTDTHNPAAAPSPDAEGERHHA